MWWGKENQNQQTGKISTVENQGKYISQGARPLKEKVSYLLDFSLLSFFLLLASCDRLSTGG
jgi:hypothetical protein